MKRYTSTLVQSTVFVLLYTVCNKENLIDS